MESKKATPNLDRINPRECINGKLRRLHRMLNGVYENSFKPYGLQGSMLSILFIIGKRKHINQKNVAEMLVLDQSTMSRDLKKLVARGWVQINKGGDSRHSELELTQSGYDLLEEIIPVWEQLHRSFESLLGKFSIQQIDSISEAVKSHIPHLKK